MIASYPPTPANWGLQMLRPFIALGRDLRRSIGLAFGTPLLRVVLGQVFHSSKKVVVNRSKMGAHEFVC